MALIFWIFNKESNQESDKIKFEKDKIIGMIFKNTTLIRIGVVGSLSIGTMVGLYNFLPLYLVDKLGMDINFGALSVTIYHATSIPAIFLFGLLSDRYGRKLVTFLRHSLK